MELVQVIVDLQEVLLLLCAVVTAHYCPVNDSLAGGN